jgi:hypothetical protein
MTSGETAMLYPASKSQEEGEDSTRTRELKDSHDWGQYRMRPRDDRLDETRMVSQDTIYDTRTIEMEDEQPNKKDEEIDEK